MNESKIENQGLKFDLMRAQEPSEDSEDEQDQEDQKAEAPMLTTEAGLDPQLKSFDNSNKGEKIPSIPEHTNEDDKP